MPKTKRPRISVFTPSHDTRFLEDAYKSLLSQTFEDWEWIVVLNGSAIDEDLEDIFYDSRVTILDASDETAMSKNVGALKRECVEYCSGDILVELDHDDMLAEECLQYVSDAFKVNPNASLVYTDWAQINEDGTPNDERWNEAHGWVYRDVLVTVDGVTNIYLSPHAMPPLPTNVALIWYAPNHVRAFSRTAYDKVDGYDANRNVMDDGDLMTRLYQVGPFVHIPDCLYLQRVGLTGTVNTQKDPKLNEQIQADTLAVYNAQMEGLMTAWCLQNDLDMIYLDQSQMGEWPSIFETITKPSSVGFIMAPGVLQYLSPQEVVPFMAEAYRVLAHGGMLMAITPSTDGRLAFMRFDYLSYWNENTFWQFVNPQWSSPDIAVNQKWQLTRSFTYSADQFGEVQQLLLVRADLVAIKDGGCVAGVNLWKQLVHENPTGAKSVGTVLE